MEAARAARLDESVRQAYSWDKQPFPSYALTNNSAEIRRLKQRIEKLTVNQEVGFVGWTFDGGEVVANSEENRLQILFDGSLTSRKKRIKRQRFQMVAVAGRMAAAAQRQCYLCRLSYGVSSPRKRRKPGQAPAESAEKRCAGKMR